MNEGRLRQRIEEVAGRSQKGKIRVFTDTSSFMNITHGDVIVVGGRHYWVYGEETEGRFGIDEQPKLWVKRAWDLESGERKILKLAFLENFTIKVGGVEVRCFRSPTKEARILDKIYDDPRFMQGFSVEDDAGNLVRVLDRIKGISVFNWMRRVDSSHEEYFHWEFPALLASVIESVRAIALLHEDREIHGDIRNDHLWLDRETGNWRWIDFDYAYEWTENPFGMDLYGLGNVLLFTAGKGFFNAGNLADSLPRGAPSDLRLEPEDFSLFVGHRIMNLAKLFPYIPNSLNRILMRFAHKVEILYTDTAELIADLERCLEDVEIGEEP